MRQSKKAAAFGFMARTTNAREARAPSPIYDYDQSGLTKLCQHLPAVTARCASVIGRHYDRQELAFPFRDGFEDRHSLRAYAGRVSCVLDIDPGIDLAGRGQQ